MRVVDVPVGWRGVDCATPVTVDAARALKARGVDFVVRYLGQVTAAELAVLFDAGLGVELVTFSRAPGWDPSAELGTKDGDEDVARLVVELKIPPGMVVWIDLEGPAGDAAVVAEWVSARASRLVNAGFIAGLYVGDGCVLNGEQLYALPEVTRYWRAFNYGIPEPACGFCQFQLYPPDIAMAGILVDLDFSQHDHGDRAPTMLVSG